MRKCCLTLRESHSDPQRNDPLGDCRRVLQVEQPAAPIDCKEPTLKEVAEGVKRERSRSASGPSGIPYKVPVYKRCPKLSRRLWKLLKVIWRKETIPESWKIAEGVMVPKEKDTSKISQFSTVSLLSVAGKVFFAVLAWRLTAYMTNNGYIDTSVQKEGFPEFQGC